MTHRTPTRIGRPELADDPPVTGHMHMWDLSYYGWLDDGERKEFWDWAFGPYLPANGSIEAIAFLLQREVASNFGGEQDEFLLVEGPLQPDEYLLIERYIEYCWHILPSFLEDRRSQPVSRTDRAVRRRKLVI